MPIGPGRDVLDAVGRRWTWTHKQLCWGQIGLADLSLKPLHTRGFRHARGPDAEPPRPRRPRHPDTSHPTPTLMPRRRTRSVCSCTGCPEHQGSCPQITPTGRCPRCTRATDRARGTPTQRGYGTEHRDRFREGVLAKHPYCQVRSPGCTLTSTVADHWPRSRRELVDDGEDPNDPKHGRGLCHRCHSTETATHQPGGWNAG